MIKTPYTEFKEFVTSMGIESKVKYILAYGVYNITVQEDAMILMCELSDSSNIDATDVADFEANLKPLANIKQSTEVINLAFSSNKLDDGSVLYLKIHGMKAMIPAGASHEFLFTIPYAEVYLQGAEIFVDILAQTDMSVKHPIAGVLEQYGYDVCMGKVIYERESKYAARLPQGLQISAVCTNTELVEQEMGVNFLLHEIRAV